MALKPIAFLLLAAACLPRPPAVGPKEDPGAPAGFDLSGEWILGTAAEPAESVVTVQRPCGETVTRWRLYQAGERFGAVLLAAAALPETPRELPVKETAWGTVTGHTLEAESIAGVSASKTTRWRLQYDPGARRLRGTRDGVRVWLAPLEVVSPAGCRDALTEPVPFSLDGAWQVGSGAPEPAATVLVEHRNCTHHPATWTLAQRGDRIEAWSFPETFDQGIARREPPVRLAPESTGTLSGYTVVLDGPVRHRLRYDPESGHLHGTRDGVAVWAVRRQLVPPGPCLPVP